MQKWYTSAFCPIYFWNRLYLTLIEKYLAITNLLVFYRDLIYFSIFFQAYDNVESSVRKASVFCMVALHQLVGDQLQPHLSSLNGSKLKLLNLYIKRAEAQSTPASPRLTPPWFSFWMKNFGNHYLAKYMQPLLLKMYGEVALHLKNKNY